VTALSGFERLECEGRYSAAPGVAPQDVVVQFGNASLTILTFDDLPLAHWPLASLHRRPGEAGRVLLSPDANAPETLEIDDATMRSAVDTVASRPPVASRPRRRGRAAWLVMALLVGLIGGTYATLRWSGQPYAVLAAQLPQEGRVMLGSAAIRAHAGEALCANPALVRMMRQIAGTLADDLGLRPVLFVVRARAGVTASIGGAVMIGAETLREMQTPQDLAALVAQAVDETRAAGALEIALREAGYAAIPAMLRGQVTAPRLVAAAADEFARRAAHSPETVAAPAALSADRDAVMTLWAGIDPVDWQRLKAVCAP
jgi:hypothetical protein